MRAREIPNMLFARILDIAKIRKVHAFEFEGGVILKTIFLKKPKAIIGLMECKFENGIFSFLKAWDSNFSPEHFLTADLFCRPDFQVVAGPLCESERDKELGQKYTEAIKVEFSNATDRNVVEFMIDDPFLLLISQITKAAILLERSNKPAKHSYWERGFAQKINYLD